MTFRAALQGLSLTFILILSSCSLSSESTSKGATPEISELASAEIWLKSATPGLAHERLRRLSGRWNVESRFWSSPGATPEVDRATSVQEMILDGRFVLERYSGTVMGKHFDGYGMTGFDNVSRQYISIWTDTLSTGLLQSVGQWNPDRLTIEFTGEYNDPLTGGRKHVRSATTLIDHNQYRYEMFERLEGGQEFKSLELNYRRVG